MNRQIFKCYIKTLSPIHIGCDEVYEPTGFVMNEQKRQLTVFNPVDFITNLSQEDKKHFNDICFKGTVASILELYQFLYNRPADGRKVDVCRGFLDHYKKTVSMNINNERKIGQELNKFSIPRTSFLQMDQRPYLPGSSIKGSFRTAYLNLLEKQKQLAQTKGQFRDNQNLEKELMNYSGIQDDPFRLVKISDFLPVGDVKTKIIYGINQKKKVTDRGAQGMPLLFETIQPGAVFSGIISVEKPEKSAGIKNPVNYKTLLQSALKFYSLEKNREENELSIVGITSQFVQNNNAVLLRCGRHSGAESVTIEGHRSIKIMGKRGERPKYKNRATTFWLVSDVKNPNQKNNLYPFGWSELYEINESDEKGFSVKEQEYQEKLHQEKQKKLEAAQKMKNLELERAEAEKQKAKEDEKKRLAEEKRKAELENMTPEQRLLAEFNDPFLITNRVVEIYNQLDDLSEEWQKKIANALKDYWLANGKWKEKKQSKKMKLKVKKIKTILGEI